jgi:AcrR family transcriptional regulator
VEVEVVCSDPGEHRRRVEGVKTRSTYRQEQAAATRDRIADAARRLFASTGYGTTTMDAIAAEAGVAVRTVYSAFGAKREILCTSANGG